MTRRHLFALAAPLALALSACATTSPGPDNAAAIAAAVAAPDRPEAARKLDESRKPAEVLRFLGIAPGMHAADLMTGSGYWAELMGHIVGSNGSVTALEATQFYSEDKMGADWRALRARTPNVTLATYPFETFAAAPRSFDFAVMNLNYHDLYWQSDKYGIGKTDPDAFLRTLYAAMRPGGVIGVIDHVGPAGDTRAIVDKLHRIDPATVRADFERAGFKLEATSDLLANPADDHTLGVFDPAIRGKTDRVLYRFRKPG